MTHTHPPSLYSSIHFCGFLLLMLQLLDTAVSLSHSSHHSFASLIGCQTSIWLLWLHEKTSSNNPTKNKWVQLPSMEKCVPGVPKSLPIFLFRTGHKHWHTFSLCTQVFVFMIAPESTAPGVTHRFPFFLENLCGCGSLLGYKNPLNYIICRTKKLSQFRFFHFPEKPMWICGKFLHDSYELQARFHRPRLHLNPRPQMYTNVHKHRR